MCKACNPCQHIAVEYIEKHIIAHHNFQCRSDRVHCARQGVQLLPTHLHCCGLHWNAINSMHAACSAKFNKQCKAHYFTPQFTVQSTVDNRPRWRCARRATPGNTFVLQSGMYCNVKKSSFRKIKLALYNCKLVKCAAICDVCNFLLETVHPRLSSFLEDKSI